MIQPRSQLTKLTSPIVAKLRKHPEDLISLRELHSTLTKNLRMLDEPTEFLAALLYKGLIEDILQNSLEDDYLESKALHETINLLVTSWDKALTLQEPEARIAWIDQMTTFAAQYRRLPWTRHVGDYVTIDAVKFLTASGSGSLSGLPSDDPTTSQAFPNLDASLTDPKTSWEIRGWYVDKLRRLRQDLQKEGGELGLLCFIEKPYATVGALSLLAHLVEQLHLPATIFRSGYWDEQARLTGTRPKPGTSAALIYDVSIRGSVLLEASAALCEAFNVKTEAAFVMYDFEKGAEQTLEQHGIRLHAYRRRHQIEPCLREAFAILTPLGESEVRMANAARERGEPLPPDEVDKRNKASLQEVIAAYEAVLAGSSS